MNMRQLLLNLVIVIVVLAIGGGIAYETYESNNYVSTDNASVTMPVVTVSALAAGAVAAVPVTVGEKVTAGETLAQLQLASASASKSTTAAPTATKSRKAAAAATAASAAATSLPVGVQSVTSPVTGIVSAVDVTGGQTVLPGQTLVQVSEPVSSVVVANVPETSIRNVVDGQSVDITLDAYPGTTFKGHVQTIEPATQASLSLFPASALSGSFTKVTQLVPVYITFDPQGDVLYNGLSAEVQIHTGNGNF